MSDEAKPLGRKQRMLQQQSMAAVIAWVTATAALFTARADFSGWSTFTLSMIAIIGGLTTIPPAVRDGITRARGE